MAPTVRIEDPFAQQPGPASGFALFNYGFRPFFLLAGLYGVVSVLAWLWLYDGGDWSLKMASRDWHAHEMLFGYSTAAIAGFFLTVVPNWTRAKAQKGAVLVVLAGLWLIGRVAMWAQGWLPYGLVMVADLAFLIALTAVVVRPLAARQHRRQFVFVPILLCLIAGNAMMHIEVLGVSPFGADLDGIGKMLGLDAIVVLVAVMGGRVTPSFTSSYLGHADPAGQVHQSERLDRGAVWATWAVLAADVLWPQSPLSGGLALAAAVLHLMRLAGWRGLKTLSNPILWVLHLGYLWLAVGLMLKGVADIGGMGHAQSLHALTIGAIGTMTLGIMTRASLGHTGREVKAKPVIVLAYAALSLSALARLGLDYWSEHGWGLMGASGALWIFAFGAFLWVYAPILMRPRIDGRPG